MCERKVAPNIQFVERQAAIHLAIAKGNLPIVQLLTNRPNIDLTPQNIFGETSLFMSISGKNRNLASKENTAIYKCAKLIIEKYNQHNLAAELLSLDPK